LEESEFDFNTSELEESETFTEFEAAMTGDKQLASTVDSGSYCKPDGQCASTHCCSGKKHKTLKCADGYRCGAASKLEESEFDFNTSELEESETFTEFEAAMTEDKQLASWSAGSGHRCIPVGTCLGNYPVADDCCGRQMHYTMRCCNVGACYRCGAAEEEEGTPSLQVHDLGDEAEDEESNYSDAQLNATIDSSGHRCIADGLCSFGDNLHCCNGWHYTLNCPDQYRCGVIKMEEEGTFVV
jgi:hypothetical protein